jgi:hypothetical protein
MANEQNDILYYSNYCKHSKKILDFLVKGGIVESLSCICIDKRTRDTRTNQIVVVLENGKQALLPPNVKSVPALLLVNSNYKLVLGNEIIKYFEPKIKEKLASANFGNGEPLGYAINAASGSSGSNIVSEHFTYYNMTPEELSAKGAGGRRQMYNYVPVTQDTNFIQTPPDTYRPDKIASGVTIETLQEQRNAEVPQKNQAPQFEYQSATF